MEHPSFDRTLTKEDDFWVSNLMTSQKIIFTSEVTVSVRILVGPQPFFLAKDILNLSTEKRGC